MSTLFYNKNLHLNRQSTTSKKQQPKIETDVRFTSQALSESNLVDDEENFTDFMREDNYE